MNATVIQVETMSIPSYPRMQPEPMPMFNENRQHQGTKGNPYPVMPVLSVVRTDIAPRDYEVVRLENDYIRLILIPELGGRIFEAYDKINQYDFLYRQHVVKPALIGAYGLWMSGGLEFNWPFHHRPSTFMPVNFKTEVQADGTAICWLSECDPTDRTRSTIGIVLRPDAAFFETRIQVTNRTPLRHSFLMWQNAAVRVNDDYQFIFPPDVNYVNHHHSSARTPLTYPMAKGAYAGAYYDEEVDISWYKNSIQATSHFAAPSKYDFFGGYDHGKKCGVIHIADHHVSPGKKMFTWGCGGLGASWEKALTDADGRYCELMAGSYSNNQPDFTWLNPYETKCFSEYWYPVGAVGKTSFATLEAAVSVDLKGGAVRVQTTGAQKGMKLTLKADGAVVFETVCDTEPGVPQAFAFEGAEGMYSVDIISENGVSLLHYAQEKNDETHFPQPVELNPHPQKLATVQELYLQGVHIDQYRDPRIAPDIYFEEALRRDANHIPTLIALGEYKYRNGYFKEAKKLLEKAIANEHIYNLHYPDGEAEYLLGLTLDAMGDTDGAYNSCFAAAWSSLTVPKAMCKVAAIDGRRGEYAKQLAHAETALEAAARHPLASVYAALAEWKLGYVDKAAARLDKALAYDPLNELALYAKVIIGKAPMTAFTENLRSDLSQTALDIAYDLLDAGYEAEAETLLASVENPTTPMIAYTLADIISRRGGDASAVLTAAAQCEPKLCYPYRIAEMLVLERTDDAKAFDLLAGLLYDRKHYACATKLWEKAHALLPEDAKICRNLAIAWFSHAGKQAEALELLIHAMELAPENDQLKLEYLYAANKAGEAPKKRLEIIKKYPLTGKEKDDYTLEYARSYLLAGCPDDAERVMLAHEFVPAEGGERAITEMYIAIQLYKGRKALEEGRCEDALAIFKSVTGALPENLHAGFWSETDLIPANYYAAIAAEKLGREAESMDLYRLVMKRFNRAMPDLAFYYVKALRKLGQHVEARLYLGDIMRMIESKVELPSIGWENNISAFNSYVIDQQTQREGMAAYWQGMIDRCEGRQTTKAFFEESLAKWPENMNTWLELSF